MFGDPCVIDFDKKGIRRMNDVIVNKTGSIQKCVKRAREELECAGDNFGKHYPRQDAAVMNLTRACEQETKTGNTCKQQR